MEQQKPKTGKFALNFGALMGGLSIVFMLMLYFMDMHYQGGIAIVIVSVLITLGVILAALSAFKKANNGFMSLSQALKVGVGACLIGGIVSMIFQLILSNVIDPEMTAKSMAMAEAQMTEMGLSREQIDAQLEMSKKFQSPLIQAAFGLIFSIFMGFVLTLIPGLIMKKTESDF